jgi:uncharacterized RDD family membrane protein YckC
MENRRNGYVMDALSWWKDKFDKALRLTPRKKPEASPYATFYERLMASGIDIVVLFLFLGRPFRMLSDAIYSKLPPDQVAMLSRSQKMGELFQNAAESGFLSLWVVNFVIQIMLIGTLLVGFQMWLKTTPGKWIMGLKITTRDLQSSPASWRFILRFFAYAVSCLPLMLGVVWLSLDPERRAWHDRIAGTRVITMRPQGWYWAQIKRGFFWVKAKISA